MFGFSWEACIGLIISLFILLFACPAGVKKTADQVISAQTYYGGGYLSLIAALLNVVIYVALADQEISGPVTVALSIWGAVFGSIFGAFYWTALCLYIIKKIRTRSGLAVLFLAPLLPLGLNYLNDIERVVVSEYPLVGLKDSTTDAIAIGLCLTAVIAISYCYHHVKGRWQNL